jgi:hypothetical protein
MQMCTVSWLSSVQCSRAASDGWDHALVQNQMLLMVRMLMLMRMRMPLQDRAI